MNYNIPMPSESEKRKARKAILRRGLPREKTIFSLLREMRATIGLRQLFFGTGDCLYLSALLCFLVYAAMVAMASRVMYTAVFTVSPLLYLCFWLLITWKEEVAGISVLQWGCKYTPVHISAVRMLVFGGVSMLADLPLAALSARMQTGDFWQLLLLAFCSLFLYAVVMLVLLLYLRAKQAVVVLPFLWFSACLLPVFYDSMQWELLLQRLPTLLLAAAAVCMGAVYGLLLNTYIKKEKEYADG